MKGSMSYKVFLVEDEIVTGEGIRDNVDWESTGFEFCGEAQDGEIALPLIEKTQPDVLITDIKMPFMDGLQLSEIVRQQMPWVKVVILSGHDEFEFAQSAIKLGVSEYLLKPISAVEIQKVLQKIAATLDQEKEERANLKELQSQVKDILALKRERLLLELVVGGISSSDVVEEYGQIGIDLIAEYYLVVLIKVNHFENNGHLDPVKHQAIRDIVTDLTDMYPGAFCTQNSVEELLLILMGDDPEQLKQDGLFLAGLIKEDIEATVGDQAMFGAGTVQQRLADINKSFADALTVVNRSNEDSVPGENNPVVDLIRTSKLDQSALEHFLRTGLIEDFDVFFRAHLHPISEAALHSTLIKH
jgi:two-component system response regulator YesN